MNPFKKKRGLAAAPTAPSAYTEQVHAFLAGLTLEDKARVVAASRTKHGDMELRVRILQCGGQQMSVWLALRGTDEAIKLVPKPEQEAAA